MANGLSAQPKPARSRVRNCSVSARVADSVSKCQGARSRHGRSLRLERGREAGCAPSGASNSAGRSRSISASSAASAGEFHDAEAAGRQIQPGETEAAMRAADAGQHIVAPLFQQRLIGDACPG